MSHQVLLECGYEMQVQKNVSLAQGDACIDIWRDDHCGLQNIIAVECKHWADQATKNVVLSTVVCKEVSNRRTAR